MRPVVISLSDELIELLADNGVDLFEELRKNGLDVERPIERPKEIPVENTGARTVELIILASAAAVVMVGPTVIKLIDTLGHRADCTTTSWIPQVDENGVQVLDPDGKPVFQVIQSTPLTTQDTSQVSGLGFSFNSATSRGPA